MCGIAGIAAVVGEAEAFRSAIDAMTSAQAHRGPDDSGVDIVSTGDPAILLGHRRLSIIDLSAAGHQPMCDPSSGAWITFNGEIYNYLELRDELIALGHRFRTRTDTEVILKAYSAWGSNCVTRLRGIFALGMWLPEDRVRPGGSGELLLARDHLGVKPLYYWVDDTTLLFSSEVRAILESGIVRRAMDLDGLHSFLSHGSVQEPFTLVRGIRSLPPGHVLRWRDGRASTERYWTLPESAHGDGPVRMDELNHLLHDAIRLQLIADVPLGVFLSGGIDSTAIAALAQQASKQPVRTFSIVFSERKYDERAYAAAAARHIGSDHAEIPLSGPSVLAELPRALDAFDQPSMDGLNTYFVARAVRDAGLTVALSGVGGDELFGGYDEYRKSRVAETWARRLAPVPHPLRAAAAAGLRRVSRTESHRKAAALLGSTGDPYPLTRSILGDDQIERLLRPDVYRDMGGWSELSMRPIEREVSGYDEINRASAWDLRTYMVSTLLRDTDQMSMSHALEVRVPLLDYRLVDHVFALPGAVKLEGGQPKPLLTRPLDGLLPAECVHRAKRGFELPFAIWLRESLEPEVREALVTSGDAPGSPLSSTGMASVWRQFQGGRIGWSRVWALFVLIHWLRTQRIGLP